MTSREIDIINMLDSALAQAEEELQTAIETATSSKNDVVHKYYRLEAIKELHNNFNEILRRDGYEF